MRNGEMRNVIFIILCGIVVLNIAILTVDIITIASYTTIGSVAFIIMMLLAIYLAFLISRDYNSECETL